MHRVREVISPPKSVPGVSRSISVEAARIVRIAQVATPDLFLSRTVAEGREMWHTGALRRAPDPAVLVDHGAQRVGRVFALEEWDFPDGTWTVVRCQLRTVPEWLRGGSCGSAASMG